MDIADTQAYIWRLGVYFADNEQKQNKDEQEFRQQVSKTQWWWQRCSWQRKNKCAPGSDSRASSQGHGCSVRATAEPQSQQRSQGDTCLFGTGDLARDPGRGRNRPRGLPGGRTPPRMLLRVELCPLLSPNPYVDILTPQCLRIWSDLEIGLLQVQLVQMKSSWWRVGPWSRRTDVLIKYTMWRDRQAPEGCLVRMWVTLLKPGHHQKQGERPELILPEHLQGEGAPADNFTPEFCSLKPRNNKLLLF